MLEVHAGIEVDLTLLHGLTVVVMAVAVLVDDFPFVNVVAEHARRGILHLAAVAQQFVGYGDDFLFHAAGSRQLRLRTADGTSFCDLRLSYNLLTFGETNVVFGEELMIGAGRDAARTRTLGRRVISAGVMIVRNDSRAAA